MSKENLVCYGDIVYLDLEDYILFSSGFYDPTLYAVTRKYISLQSFRNGLFQLYPNYSYKDVRQVSDLTNQLDLLKAINPNEELAGQELQSQLEKEKATIEEREEKLKVLNKKIYEETKGMPIKYGQKVQLFHLESEQFLGVSKKAHKEEKSLSILEMKPEGSKDLYFILNPALKFRNDGDYVEYDQPVKLTSYKNNFTIQLGSLMEQTRLINPDSNSFVTNSELWADIPPRRPEPLYENSKIRYTGLRAMDRGNSIWVRKFVTDQQLEKYKKKNLLKNGEYIRITDGTVFLTVDQNRQTNKHQLYFQQNVHTHLAKYNVANTVFQAIEITAEDEDEIPEGAELVDDDEKRYLLRHIVSGQYLGLHGQKMTLVNSDTYENLDTFEVTVENGMDEDEDKEITRNSALILTIIKHDNPQMRRVLAKEMKPQHKIREDGFDKDSECMHGFEQTDHYLDKLIKPIRYDIDLYNEMESEEEQNTIFRFLYVSDEEMTSVFYVESYANELQKLVDYLHSFVNDPDAKVKELNKKFSKFLNISKSFIQGLFDLDEDEIYEEGQEEALQPHKLRQALIRDFRIYDLMFRLFYYLNVDSTVDKKIQDIKDGLGIQINTLNDKIAKKKSLSESNRIPDKRQASIVLSDIDKNDLNNLDDNEGEEEEEEIDVEDINNSEIDTEKEEEEEESQESEEGDSTKLDRLTIEKNEDIDYKLVLQLFQVIHRIMIVSFKQEELNHAYASQFVRVSINAIIKTENGVFSKAPYYDLIAMKEQMLAICKLGLWDEDLEALHQLNNYQNEVFRAIEQQPTYHSVYIELIQHISLSKSPIVINKIRNSFITSFLQNEQNFNHVFPQIKEHQGKMYVIFSRKASSSANYQVPLMELDESIIINLAQKEDIDIEILRKEEFTSYLLKSLYLIYALVQKYSTTLDLLIIKHYPFDILTKAINEIKSSSSHYQTKMALTEILNSVHQNYFSVTLTKIPKRIQVINKDSKTAELINETHQFIENASNTSISQHEWDSIQQSGAMQIITDLKNQLKRGGLQNEIDGMMSQHNELSQESTLIVEGIKKILTGINSDVEHEFIRKAHDTMIQMMSDAVKTGTRGGYYSLIKNGLKVFTLIEKKLISFAAIDIIDLMAQNHAFTGKKKKKQTIMPQVKIFESISKFASFNKGTSKYLSGSLKQEPPQKSPLVDKVAKIQAQVKSYLQDKVVPMLFDVFLTKDEHLSREAIRQLKRLSAFEVTLFEELQEIVIIENNQQFKKISDLIKIMFTLNKIAREVNYCTENKIRLSPEILKQYMGQTMSMVWDILFSVYDPSKHFQIPTNEQIIPGGENDQEPMGQQDTQSFEDAKRRFKKAFTKYKGVAQDPCFEYNEEAIDRSFQKVFNALGLSKVLFRTLGWVMSLTDEFKKQASPEYSQSILMVRAIIVCQIITLNKNDTAQELFSEMRSNIKLFYNKKFMNYGADTRLMFFEMMRDNRYLLKLPYKYLYEIVLNQFVNTISKKTLFNEKKNSHLAASLRALPILAKSAIPEEIFNLHKHTKAKWQEIYNEIYDYQKMSIVGVLKTQSYFVQPIVYYSLVELMKGSIDIVDAFSNNPQQIDQCQFWMTFDQWIPLLEEENVLLQFEFRNYVTKCIYSIYYKYEKKSKFVQDSQEARQILGFMLNDLMFFLRYFANRNQKQLPKLSELMNKSNVFADDSSFQDLLYNYLDGTRVDLSAFKVVIGMEETTLERMLYEYIFDGCLDLFFAILASHSVFCSENFDKKHPQIKTLFDYSMEIIDLLITNCQDEVEFPHSKFERFFGKASMLKAYLPQKNRIIEMTNSMISNTKTPTPFEDLGRKSMKPGDDTGVEQSPIEAFYSQFDNLLKNKKLLKESNIQEISDYIAGHPSQKAIIKGLIQFLWRDQSTTNFSEIKFILKLLRKFISRENKKEDKPIFLWKEAGIRDLRKIKIIQEMYYDEGLTELLFEYLKGDSEFSKNDSLFTECLHLSLAYLYGGNVEIQEDFYNYFSEDTDNKAIGHIGMTFQKLWNKIRKRENDRIRELYIYVQRNVFNYYKGKKSKAEIDDNKLIAYVENNLDERLMMPSTAYSETNMFIITMTFLQALCEHQYSKMQNHLREQNDKMGVVNIDFLSLLRHIMNNYYKGMSRYNLIIGNKVLELIVELVQGDVQENIKSLLHKTFIYDMCKVLTDYNTRYHTLPRGFGFDPFHSDLSEFKGNVVECFRIILENRNENTYKKIKKNVDVKGLLLAMQETVEDYMKRKKYGKKIGRATLSDLVYDLKWSEIKDELKPAIGIYIIFRYMWEDVDDFSENINDLIKEVHEESDADQAYVTWIIFNLFPQIVQSIEIIDEEKEVQLLRIYFPVHSVCHSLTNEAKHSFLKKVDRSNSQTKISGLIDSSQEFITQMYTEYDSRNRVFGINPKSFYYFVRNLTNLIALTIALINIFTYETVGEDPDDVQQESVYEIVNIILTIIQICVALALVIMWAYFFRRRHQAVKWERMIDKNVKKQGILPTAIVKKIERGEYEKLEKDECMSIMMLKGANSEEFKTVKEEPSLFQYVKWKYIKIQFLFIMSSRGFLWQIFYLLICIGSLFHPIVAIFQILDIAIRSDTIGQIYHSVARNRSQFLWTLFLLVLVNFIYSSIGFFFINSDFDVGEEGETQYICLTAIECFLNVLNLGLRNGGGIADAIEPKYFEEGQAGAFIFRIIFDLSFFIIMIILLLNLIFGMIIDAFGELRDQKTRDNDDQKNVCFICGIDRSEYERYANFEDHIQNEHYIWAYINYIVYLRDRYETQRNEMTDIENHIMEKLIDKDYSWVPVGRALTLETNKKQQEGKEKTVAEQVKEVLDQFKEDMLQAIKKEESDDDDDDDNKQKPLGDHEESMGEVNDPVKPKDTVAMAKFDFNTNKPGNRS